MDEKIIAILALATLGLGALILNIDSAITIASITGISGLAGYTLGKKG